METAAGAALRQVRELATEAQVQEAAARQQLTEARRWRAFWQELLAHLDAGQPASAVLLWRREEQALRCQGDTATLDALIATTEQQARTAAASFQHAFPAAMLVAGLTLDDTSRHPRYTVCNGFLHIGVQEESLTATVRPRDGAATVLGMDVEPLVETIRRETHRLFERDLDRAAFLRRLWTAYQALLQGEGRAPGDALPLRRIFARLASEAHAYAADEFNIDLARLVQSDHTLVDGHRLQLHPTRRANQGVLLWGLEQGGYAGFLSFGQEGEGC